MVYVEGREGLTVHRGRLDWLDHRLLRSSDLWDLLAARGLDLRVLVCAPAGGNSPLRVASGSQALRLGVPFVLPHLGLTIRHCVRSNWHIVVMMTDSDTYDKQANALFIHSLFIILLPFIPSSEKTFSIISLIVF